MEAAGVPAVTVFCSYSSGCCVPLLPSAHVRHCLLCLPCLSCPVSPLPPFAPAPSFSLACILSRTSRPLPFSHAPFPSLSSSAPLFVALSSWSPDPGAISCLPPRWPFNSSAPLLWPYASWPHNTHNKRKWIDGPSGQYAPVIYLHPLPARVTGSTANESHVWRNSISLFGHEEHASPMFAGLPEEMRGVPPRGHAPSTDGATCCVPGIHCPPCALPCPSSQK